MFNLKYTTRMLYHIMPQSQPLISFSMNIKAYA